MIKEIDRNNETNWYEKIRLEMTLQDLQVLYDCIGAVPNEYLINKHKFTSFNYIDDITIDLYNGMDKILSEHNGITDDNIMTNTDIELVIYKGE